MATHFGYVPSLNERADIYGSEREILREVMDRLHRRFGRRKCFHVRDVEMAVAAATYPGPVPKLAFDDVVVQLERGPEVRRFSMVLARPKSQA